MNNYSFKNDYFKKKNTDYKKNSVTTLYEHNPPIKIKKKQQKSKNTHTEQLQVKHFHPLL